MLLIEVMASRFDIFGEHDHKPKARASDDVESGKRTGMSKSCVFFYRLSS